jgi:hypothetical protein
MRFNWIWLSVSRFLTQPLSWRSNVARGIFDANPLDRDLVDDIVEAVLNASSPTALRSTQRRRRFSRSFSNK